MKFKNEKDFKRFKEHLIKSLDKDKKYKYVFTEFSKKLIFSFTDIEDTIVIKCRHNTFFSFDYFPEMHISFSEKNVNLTKKIPKSSVFTMLILLILSQLFITFNSFNENRLLIFLVTFIFFFSYFFYYSLLSMKKIEKLLDVTYVDFFK